MVKKPRAEKTAKKPKVKKLKTDPSEISSLAATGVADELSTVIFSEETPPAFTAYEDIAIITVENAHIDLGTSTQYIFSNEVSQLTPNEGALLDAELTVDETDTAITEEAVVAPSEVPVNEIVSLSPSEEQENELVSESEGDTLVTSEGHLLEYFVSPTSRLSATFVCVETARTDQNSVVHLCVDEIVDLGISIETLSLHSTIARTETSTLISSELSVPNAQVSELALLIPVETRTLNASSERLAESGKLIVDETKLLEVDLTAPAENDALITSELATAPAVTTNYIAYAEHVFIKTVEASKCVIHRESDEVLTLRIREWSDPNVSHRGDAGPSVWQLETIKPRDYTFEVRRHTGGTNYDLLGIIENPIAPTISRELGMADLLSFNMQMSDPKYSLVANPSVGLELWYYGRDNRLKQVFTLQKVEQYRDYGGAGAGSGGSTLGSGSGDNALVVGDGLESYLTLYQIGGYKVFQRHVSDILNDICKEARADNVINGLYVEPTLNKMINIDLSWENLKTACDNIIAQTGGFMRVVVWPDSPGMRELQIIPLGSVDVRAELAADIGPVHQGITTDHSYNYGFDTKNIRKYDLSWNPVQLNANAGTQIGGLSICDGSYYYGQLYVACCTIGSNGLTQKAAIGIWNASDLSFSHSVDISAQVNGLDDASSLAINADDGIIYISSYWNKADVIHKYSLSNFSYLGSITVNPPTSYVQSVKYYNNKLYLSYNLGGPADLRGGVIQMDLDGTNQIEAVPLIEESGNWLEPEGLIVDANGIQVLVWNGVAETGVVYLFPFPTLQELKRGADGYKVGDSTPTATYNMGTVLPSSQPLIIFNAFPENGNIIRNNRGSLGDSSDSEVHTNNYTVLKNGATAWAMNDESDYICIPQSTGIMNLQSMTFEWCVYIDTQMVDYSALFSKGTDYGPFTLVYDSVNSNLILRRPTIDGNIVEWSTEVGSVPANDWYYIQLMWRSGTEQDPNTPPLIYLDRQLLTVTCNDVTGYWMGDFYYDLYIGNNEALDSNLIGIISLFRLYDIALLDGAPNFISDGWRREAATAHVTYDLWPTPGKTTEQGVM